MSLSFQFRFLSCRLFLQKFFRTIDWTGEVSVNFSGSSSAEKKYSSKCFSVCILQHTLKMVSSQCWPMHLNLRMPRLLQAPALNSMTGEFHIWRYLYRSLTPRYWIMDTGPHTSSNFSREYYLEHPHHHFHHPQHLTWQVTVVVGQRGRPLPNLIRPASKCLPAWSLQFPIQNWCPA